MAPSLRQALAVVDRNAERFRTDFPSGYSRHLRYASRPNTGWTPGFWTGLLWLAYDATGDARYRRHAESYLPDFRQRIERGGDEVDTHDLGFLYTLSCLPAALLGDPAAQRLAIDAADLLMRRYLGPVGVIQAWGSLDDQAQRGGIIIDSAMNMPLLCWASGATGDPRYRDAARSHLSQLARHLVRSDGSTFHHCSLDPETGRVLRRGTFQGAADDSCWARGQAWGMYGFALSSRCLDDRALQDQAGRLADYFLQRLPGDGVCYWDLAFDDRDGEEKDTSAAAIAAAALLELRDRLSPADPSRQEYSRAAGRILSALAANHTGRADADGVLLNAVAHHPLGEGVDECCVWGDYFYLEALMRLNLPWTPRWWTHAGRAASFA